MKQLLLAALLCVSNSLFAQDTPPQPDFSTMSNFQVRMYLGKNGYVASGGHHMKVGDQFTLGKGTMPDKSFAYIYESATGFGTHTSSDLRTKGYLPSAKAGQKVTIKGFVANGTKKSGFTVIAVIQIGGDLMGYWVEVENATEAKEIILTEETK